MVYNPDYLIQAKKRDEEKLKVEIAWNQLLPQLDLTAAYGYNGLGDASQNVGGKQGTATFSNVGNAYNTTGNPSWSIGLEMHIPLGGNIKGRDNFEAAKLGYKAAERTVEGVQNQIENVVGASAQKLRIAEQTICNNDTIVKVNENLLKSQLERLRLGKVEARKVLDAEADLFDSRQNLADAKVQYQHILLDAELACGTILRNRNLELTRAHLRDSTKNLLVRERRSTIRSKSERSDRD